jgi:enoyl-CoA hydratase
MGGGVGISLPARYRIATERTTFAMPECGIGLFPDVGAAWYLSRMPGKAGLWLALTGSRIKAADCLAVGVATHFVPGESLERFKADIVADGIDTALARHAADPGPPTVIPERDALFAAGGVGDILAALRADGGDWARAQADIIESKCPMMLEVAYRELVEGARLTDFADDLAMEYALAVRTIHRPDFSEGVRAVVIDKDNNPRWSPATLGDVTGAMVDAMFEPLPPTKTWVPLR